MKIALITDGMWPYVLGGMQKHSYYLCKYLAQNKVDVDLVHFNNSFYYIDRLEFFSEEEKKYIHPVIVDFPSGNGLPGHYIRNSKKHSKLVFEAIKDRLPSYDFIYTKGFAGWHLIEQKKKGNVQCAKIGVKFHGYEMFQRPPGYMEWLQYVLLLRKPVKYITRNADIVFSYGGKITDIIRNLGVPSDKIFELPSGVETSAVSENFIHTGEKIKFLFVGRNERRKGIEELNIAIQSLKEGNFEFQFIGPIPEEKQLKDARVIYHGEVRDKQELHDRIRNCDVLVCPSWSEGMPNVILEAMASGLAVIATNVGSTNVLVNEHTGWLIDSPEPKVIAEALQKVISSTQSNIDMKKRNALDQIKQNFVWEKLILKFLDNLKNRA